MDTVVAGVVVVGMAVVMAFGCTRKVEVRGSEVLNDAKDGVEVWWGINRFENAEAICFERVGGGLSCCWKASVDC